MTEKLSQFTPASAPPALTDYVPGASNTGPPNLKYTLSQIQQTAGGLPKASQDPRFVVASGLLQLYVDVAGSDSNPGTLASPFLTISHALSVAAYFDYEFQNEPAITVGAGTFTVPGGAFGESALKLPGITNISALDSGLVQGAGAGSTIIVSSGSPFAVFQAGPDKTCNWRVGDLTIDTDTIALFSLGGTISSFDNEFRNSSNNVNMEITRAENSAEIFLTGVTTITATTFAYLFHLFFTGRGLLFNASLVLPAACTVTKSFISLFQDSSCWFQPTSITNAGGVTGNNIAAIGSSTLFTANGLVSDVPGSTGPAANKIDISSSIVKSAITGVTTNFSAGPGSFYATQFAGIPTGANISPGCWTVVKDTSGGGVYVLYNDAGTIKKVALT